MIYWETIDEGRVLLDYRGRRYSKVDELIFIIIRGKCFVHVRIPLMFNTAGSRKAWYYNGE